MKKLVFLAVLFIASTAFSQEIKNYEWEANPKFQKLTEEQEKEPAVVIFDKRWVHTRYGNLAFATFVMNHVAIKINKAEVINDFNKVKAEDNGYIRKVRDFHARVIKPDGQVKVLPPDRIVETEVEKVKSIVFEGVEVGDILEYYFIIKEVPVSNGVEFFQREIPILHAEFVTTESGVDYHVFPTSSFKVTKQGAKHTYTARNLPAFKTESRSARIKKIEKIIYFLAANNSDLFNWPMVMHSEIDKSQQFTEYTKSGAKALLKKLDIKNLPLDKKVEKIDAYIKENFGFSPAHEPVNWYIDINAGKAELKAYNIFRLYGYLLSKAKIPYQVVTSVNRFYGDIHKEFYVYPLPHEWMYYIPATKKFISPYDRYKAYGSPIYEIQGTNCLAYQPKKGKNGITFMKAPIMPTNYTINETECTLTLNEDLSAAMLEKSVASTGYIGQFDRMAYLYNEENPDKEKFEEYVKSRLLAEIECKLIEHSFANTDYANNYTNNPMIVKGKLEITESMIENAGNMLIVNLGKVIGKQAELYQEDERYSDVEYEYAMAYKHKITFIIPDGYKVENTNELAKSVKPTFKGGESCWFISTVEVIDNKVIVTIDESYNSLTYKKENYQEYRSVINASSDFYKASIVLSPNSVK